MINLFISSDYYMDYKDVFAIGYLCGKYNLDRLFGNKKKLKDACEDYGYPRRGKIRRAGLFMASWIFWHRGRLQASRNPPYYDAMRKRLGYELPAQVSLGI